MYKKISDYGIIGNLHSIALVALDGSIDWFCFPHIDSPSVFGALLDDRQGGCLAVRPRGEFDSTAHYLARTNVLVTRFRTRTGVMRLTDFMAIPAGGPEENEDMRHHLYRRVEMEAGRMEVEVIFEPRFDYARAETVLASIEGGAVAEGAGLSLALTSTRPLDLEKNRASAVWSLEAGDAVWLRIGSSGPLGVCTAEERKCVDAAAGEAALEETVEFWRSWLKTSETGRTVQWGRYEAMIERSALVLKLLYYNPTGTIAAAATTSLPETIGGSRNWDYRYTWVRDTAFTLQALFNLGHLSETEGYLRWLERLLAECGARDLQIMYGLRGERDLGEEELTHLDGYKGSRPVRIGNAAARQKQMDIYGELMDAALRLADYVGKISADLWPTLRSICDYVVEHWQDKDYGIWEVRGGPHDFVYSRVMCWVALDRGITIAGRYGFEADLNVWREAQARIKQEVLAKGFSRKKQAFIQHYGTESLDSSSLLIPLLGFLPFDHPMVLSTIEASRRELEHEGLMYRYLGEDGLEGKEGAFLLCSFWLVDCLTHTGRIEEAEAVLARLEATANHLGLFSEQYDVEWREPLGNFPQAFTHIGFVNSVMNLIRAKERSARRTTAGPAGGKLQEFVKKRLLPSEIVLNEGLPGEKIDSEDIAGRLKSAMNLLRGAFFEEAQGRVAYERMRQSPLYEAYVVLSRSLKDFNLASLAGREQRTAFWINLYNVIVIHGVIELHVKDSVKEVRNFFRRIRYNIGGHLFSPDNIEHGILRANKKPPNALFKMFGKNDPRLSASLESVDPRIHFALVCGSSSCPPIGVYTAENLDAELDVAARTFLNGGGLMIDRERRKVSLSRVFQWYGDDFGSGRKELLEYLSRFLYDREAGAFLQENASELQVEFQRYDWRLNK